MSRRNAPSYAHNNNLHAKTVFLGDAGVGKSNIVLRFAKGEFKENMESTIGAAFLTKSVTLTDNNTEKYIKFEMWDTAGQERFHSLAPLYFRGAQICVVVYDITEKESFTGAIRWVNAIQTERDISGSIVALVGNKIDLESQRAVSQKEAKQYADENDIFWTETSALTRENINELFLHLATELEAHYEELDIKRRDSPTLDDPKPNSTSSCCIVS
eukprot:CAMPEP_0174262000 /NCGR_PEP_ID=MMETSP0439-20130205/12716_1 /TAXON_ID=0 /ORGANISM="Stereomyxa ramosa, Strain Chinc5" /LENGTH=214 /DNA_ID=CAMNT_0015346627 /DNA_START=137 /DNA_END=781 /DNA_ORIENTATION=-